MVLLFIGFISLFALDVFGEPRWLLALMMHLIPSLVLVLMTVVAWKREWVGGVLFMVVGAIGLITTDFESMIIALPLLVIGSLFLVSGKWGK